MKKCPECARTYADDTLSFCLEDGALLSAPYDAKATSEPTVVLNAPEAASTVEADQIPPTVAMPEIPPTVASNIPPTVASNIPPTEPAQEIPTVVRQEIPAFAADKGQETQSENKKLRWYIYLAGFFIAVVYNFVVTMVISQIAGRAFFDFFDDFGEATRDGTLLYSVVPFRAMVSFIVAGSLGVLLGYRWHQAKWKWGIILALAETMLTALSIYFYFPTYRPSFALLTTGLIFVVPIALAAGCAAAWLGSTRRN